MGRGRGGRQSLDRYKEKRDYYEGLPSDTDYVRRARQRGSHRRRTKWLLRFLLLAAIAAAVYLWGDDVLRKVRVQLRGGTGEFKQVGNRIQSGRDARSGADWSENE